jgi:hypothetical protein
MQKLPNNAKAILGAVTLALFGFAGAKAGALVLQQQNLDHAALRSAALHGHAALSRLPVPAFKAGLVKNRRPANHIVAASSTTSFSNPLSFAGAAFDAVRSASALSLRCSASPRAPPIS